MTETTDTAATADAPETWFPFPLLFLAVFAVLFPLAILGVSQIRGDMLDAVAEELSAKHGVEFTVENRSARDVVPWTIAGVEQGCLLTQPALLCLDGSVYER